MAGDYSQMVRGIRRQAKKVKSSGEKPSKILYLGLGSIALFKDLLDFAGVGSLPGIGTVVTLCVSFLIWVLLTVFDRSGVKMNTKITRSLLILILGLVEAIGFGLNFLPIETLTVILLYVMAQKAWKKEEKKSQGERAAQTNAEMIREYQMTRAMAARDMVQQEIEIQARERQSSETQTVVQNSSQPTPVAAVPRMMSDMKLPQNTVVPQGIESPAQVPEASPGEVGRVTQGSVLTETQLRERYEQPRRDVLAGEYRQEKNIRRQKYNERKESFLKGQLSAEKNYKDIAEARVEKIDQDITRLRQFGGKNVETSVQNKQQEKEVINVQLGHDLERIRQQTDAFMVNLGQFSNNDSMIHAENKISKQAIRNTREGLDSGSLNIVNLARENNAVVVHSIPSPGWKMKNTSMNNQMIDTTNLSPVEKGRILMEKQPDVSTTIINASRKINGQQMFYPFGFIVDGKLIASYESDSGTKTSGDARRRNEAFSGTLQRNVPGAFAKFANLGADPVSSMHVHNESIVHKPIVRGILIDEEWLQKSDNYNQDLAGQAFRFAKENYPNQPVYIRKDDGIYSLEGKKVTAEEIYS